MFGDGWTALILGETVNPFNLAMPDFREWQGPPPLVPGKARSSDADGEFGTTRKRAGQSGCAEDERPTWAQADATNRAEALEGWSKVVVWMVPDSPLAAQILNTQEEKSASQSVADTFRSKATGTILKRLASIRQYGRWLAVAQSSAEPSEETTCYQYVRTLADEGAAPTRGEGFVEAMKFVLGLSGWGARIPQVVSLRVGAAAELLSRKQAVVKRAALSSKLVAELELYVCGTGDARQKVFAGTFLFMIHARLRFSEVVRLSQEPTLDLVEGFGFVEAGVKSDLVKSGQSKKRRGHTVPLVSAWFAASSTGFRHVVSEAHADWLGRGVSEVR